MSTTTVAQVVPDRRRRLLVLAICSMSLLIVGLDATARAFRCWPAAWR